MVRLVLLFFIVMTLAQMTPAFGHPPGNIDLEFDVEEHLLRVVAYHTVGDSTKHYVGRIIVELNDKIIVEQQVESQVSSAIQEVIYKIIDVRPGDEIMVTARCNISGRGKAAMMIEEEIEEMDKTPSEKE